MSFSEIKCNIFKLKGENYKVWKERILLHLGWMNNDYGIRKDKLPIDDNSTGTDTALYI